MIKYEGFNEEFIERQHGRLYLYRKMYKGEHSDIFKRAEKLLEEGEIVDNILKHRRDMPFVQTPYIVANISKLIVDTPAILVGRSIGKIDTSLANDEQRNTAVNAETDEQIEGPDDNTVNGEILNVQQELIRQIVKNSRLDQKHRGNIVQHQIDGGIVGVPWDDHRGLRVEFKGRDTYFPHEDGLGADISINRTIDEEDYLHVYRERIEREEGSGDSYLDTRHLLFKLGRGGLVEGNELPDEEAAELLNMDVDDLREVYPGRSTKFIRYWANNETIMDPLGTSALAGQENKQDEINWTLTRTASIFERNGKPRIAINQDLANALNSRMVEMYGQQAEGKFDHRQLEVITMDESGKSMEIIQIDIAKLGGVDWVKDIIKLMLMETQTSEKAIDFYMGEQAVGGQSGVAKFYDLFLSLMKAEEIQKEYIRFLKGLIEDALWLANRNDPNVQIEEPEITVSDMLPIERRELIEENMNAHAGQNGTTAQSLETTVRRINPEASEDWVQEELARIQAEQVSSDSSSLNMSIGQQTLENLLDNPDTRPAPGTTPPETE